MIFILRESWGSDHVGRCSELIIYDHEALTMDKSKFALLKPSEHASVYVCVCGGGEMMVGQSPILL